MSRKKGFHVQNNAKQAKTVGDADKSSAASSVPASPPARTTPSPPKRIPFEQLPSDHPIHQLAKRVYEGGDRFDAFHMVCNDGTHISVDINRFVGPEAVAGNSPAGALKSAKIQTGNLIANPEIGRVADWCARASMVDASLGAGPLFQRDGTHAVFLRRLFWSRILAMLQAYNAEQEAGFADMLPAETDLAEIKLPFLISENNLRRDYICPQIADLSE